MFGNNPKRSPVIGLTDILQVQSIFSTFQGEGPFVGEPAVFLRLGGCNLACKFCDTEFESFQSKRTEQIMKEISNFAKNTRKLVVITGGEPFIQPIEAICEQLIMEDYTVQIETNGTLFRNIHIEVHIVCSPKNIGNGYTRLRADLLARLTALKFVVSKSFKNYQDVAEVGQSDYNVPVYVQPMDEYNEQKNKDNLKHALYIANKYGYRLSLQTHKILDIE